MASLIDIQISRGSDADDDSVSQGCDTVCQPGPVLAGDDRRMQVRAYNHWLAAIVGEELPAIEDLHPESLGDLGAHGVVFDLTMGIDRPVIVHLGEKLAAECGGEAEPFTLGEVAKGTLLSQVTEHCLDVVSTRAPVGFDADFVDSHGASVLYRSILLPYSSDGQIVDFVFGAINWKRVDSAPSRTAPNLDTPAPAIAAAPRLADLLALARDAAQAAATLENRSHRALYRAISACYDLAQAAERQTGGLAALFRAHAVPWQERAPLVALGRMVFGADHDPTRLAEYALVLEHARRFHLAEGTLADRLQATKGGLKAIVAAERALRRGSDGTPRTALRPSLVRRLRAAQPLETERLSSAGEEFVLLLAQRRVGAPPRLLGMATDARLLERAARRLLAG